MTHPTSKRLLLTRRRLLIAIPLLLILGVVILLTAGPQIWIAESIASNVLHAEVDINGLRLFPRIHVDSIHVYDGPEERAANAPTVELNGVTMDYGMRPFIPRRFSALLVERLAVHLDQTNPQNTNFSFLQVWTQGTPEPSSAEPGSPRFIPQHVEIAALDLDARSATDTFQITGLALAADIDSTSALTMQLTGSAVSGTIQHRDTPQQTIQNGRVDLGIEIDPAETRVRALIQVPDVADIEGKVQYATESDAPATVSAEFLKLVVKGKSISAFLPPNLAFDTVDLSETRIVFDPRDLARQTEVALNGSATALTYGEKDHEWYEGDAKITGAINNGKGDIELALNNGQRVVTRIDANADTAKIVATLVDWSRDDLHAALPKDFRRFLDQMPHLKQIGGAMEMTWTDPNYDLNLTVDSLFSSAAGSKESFSLAVEGSGSTKPEDARLFSGKSTVLLGKGEAQFAIEAASSEQITAKGNLKGVELQRWLAPIADRLPKSFLESYGATVTGALNVEHQAASTGITVDLTAGPLKMGARNIPATFPLSIKGTFDCGDFSEIKSSAITLTMSENASLTIKQLSLTTNPVAFRSAIEGKIDFDYMSAELQLPPLVGALTIAAKTDWHDDTLHAVLNLNGDGFGYSRYATAYGTPLIIDIDLNYKTNKGTGAFKTFTAKWGDGTTITGKPGNFVASPFALQLPFSIQSDLVPLVDMRFIDTATGTGKADGTLDITDKGTKVSCTYDIAAETFLLKNKLAAFGGLATTGVMTYHTTLNGKGAFAAAEAAAAGARLTAVKGTFAMTEGVVHSDDAAVTIYNGQVKGKAEMDLLGETQQGKLDLTFADLDLERFTKEYEPPVVILTGLADGTANVSWNKEGLRDFKADLESTRNFSLNREAIEDMLLTALTSEVRGLKFLNRRIRKKTIGDEPQRKFDRAALSVSLLTGADDTQRIEGPILLDSETLDFTIDLGVDVGAIFEALALKQDAELENVDSISAEPVKWELPEL